MSASIFGTPNLELGSLFYSRYSLIPYLPSYIRVPHLSEGGGHSCWIQC
jgi:hypothetical protein